MFVWQQKAVVLLSWCWWFVPLLVPSLLPSSLYVIWTFTPQVLRLIAQNWLDFFLLFFIFSIGPKCIGQGAPRTEGRGGQQTPSQGTRTFTKELMMVMRSRKTYLFVLLSSLEGESVRWQMKNKTYKNTCDLVIYDKILRLSNSIPLQIKANLEKTYFQFQLWIAVYHYLHFAVHFLAFVGTSHCVPLCHCCLIMISRIAWNQQQEYISSFLCECIVMQTNQSAESIALEPN